MPGNTTYRRDLSVSFNRLADLARAAGRSGDAETLYRQALQVAEELAEAEPGSTTYRRDLSISYERLAAVAVEAGAGAPAERLLTLAIDARRSLYRQEPHRADLAEELGYALYLLAAITDEPDDLRREVIDILTPFETGGTTAPRATVLIRWARQPLTE